MSNRLECTQKNSHSSTKSVRMLNNTVSHDSTYAVWTFIFLSTCLLIQKFHSLDKGIFFYKAIHVTKSNLSLLPTHKANLLTPGSGEGKCSIYYKAPHKENGWLMLRNPKLTKGFQQRLWKSQVREKVPGSVISSCTLLWLVDGDRTGWCHRG